MWMGEGVYICVCVCVGGENQDEHGKSWVMTQCYTMENEKGVENTKWLIIIPSTDMAK